MFLPSNLAQRDKEEEERKAAFKRIEEWCLEIIPAEIREEALVSIQEVQCGDPQCAPIDTAITIVFERYEDLVRNFRVHDGSIVYLTKSVGIAFYRGGDGIIGLPMEAQEVTKEELESSFPTRDVLTKWYRGEEAEWPPIHQSEPEMPQLRFDIGTRVLCRIGTDAEKDWALGEVVMLWYRELNWPPGSFAPYKIKLDDGRCIFAPGDMDQIIRKAPDGMS
jgi:hypothetical protein